MDLLKALRINPEKEEKRIAGLVKSSLSELGRDGVVIGLSGGLDSSAAAYLLARILPKRKILGLILPERDSSPENMKHARMVAKNLGLKTIEIDMTPVLKKIGVYKIGPKELDPKTGYKEVERTLKLAKKILGQYNIADSMTTLHGGKPSKVLYVIQKLFGSIYKRASFGFTKVRMRMIHLFFHAWQRNYAVIGTTNKSEYALGIFDPHGDGAGNIALLKHLYRTQIKQLAEYLGVPKEITGKPSSGDIYGGNISKEEAYGMSYEQLDSMLLGMEKGISDKQLQKIFPKKAVEECKRAIAVSNLGKKQPLSLS